MYYVQSKISGIISKKRMTKMQGKQTMHLALQPPCKASPNRGVCADSRSGGCSPDTPRPLRLLGTTVGPRWGRSREEEQDKARLGCFPWCCDNTL